MKIILIKDVIGLGEQGDVVTVKDGYGRNFLIPRLLGVMATPGAVKAVSEERRQASRKFAKRKDEQLALVAQLEKTEVVVHSRVGEENRIFGTVTPTQVGIELTKQGFEIDRRLIELNEDIRMIGVYSATVRLSSEAIAQVKVRVEPLVEEGESA
ncbi:MAG: 50S ribosomal protein L9 [Rhodothermales bacterium]|nr:50S ribosomal protein L9 [Rhodothermales bacterium]